MTRIFCIQLLTALAFTGAALVDTASAAEKTPQVTLRCTGTEERQVRDVVPTEKGGLKMGEFGAPQKVPDSFVQIFKTSPFKVVVKDRRSVTSTQDCEVKGQEFVCTISQPRGKTTSSIVFNLDTGAYSTTVADELVKSTRTGTCDMAEAKALMASNPPPPGKGKH